MENLKKPGVYPKDGLFEVGSNFTFCCILQAGESFNSTTSIKGLGSSESRQISNQTYALTVHLTEVSKNTCTNVYCTLNHGACAYIGCEYGLIICWLWFWSLKIHLTKCCCFMLAMTQTHLKTRTFSVKPRICSQLNVTGQSEDTQLYPSRAQQFTTYLDGIIKPTIIL